MPTTEDYAPPAHGFRTFLIVWASQSISVFGSGITTFAIIIWLTQTLYPHPAQKAQLALALSAVSLAGFVAAVFGAPLAGAWADRHDRKHTMIWMNLASGGVSLLEGLLIGTHLMQLWMLVVLTLVDNIFGSFHDLAFNASYSMIVPEKHLPRANGMVQTVFSFSGILSPGIAAALISLPDLARHGLIPGAPGAALGRISDGTPLALTLDAITFVIMAVTLVFLTIPSPTRADLRSADGKRAKSYWADIKEGALYIWRRRPLLWLLGAFTVANFVGSSRGVFNPLIVKFDLAADWSARGFSFDTALALLSAMTGFGGLAGGLLVSTWGGLKRRRVYGVIIPMLFSSLLQIFFGLSPLLYLSAGLTFGFMAMTPILNAHSQSIWQTQTPREMQGRVFAVRRLIAQCTLPIGTLLAGFTGGLFNPGLVMAILGGCMFLFCLGQLFNPALLRVEDKVYLEQLAAS
jgi:DHA3 family macrolide efflux protein-like MFS transporter